jgi:hypothetical protein
MSVKIELYNKVKEAIGTIPEIKTFGHYNNQFNTEEEELPSNNPAVFIEFSNMSWSPSMQASFNARGTQQQKSEALQFTLYISYWSHEEEEDRFLSLLGIVDKVYRALANIESDNINPLQRVSEEDDSDHTEPIVWRTTFSTMVTEPGVLKNVSDVYPVSVNVQTGNV